MIAALGAMLLLASCRLDATVTVEMHDDGSGVVTVAAVADAELAKEVPNLADELRLGDVRAAGWQVKGPTGTKAGGLRITLTHDFRDADEATALLSSLGGPFADLTVMRTIDGEGDDASALNSVSGRAVLQQGFDGFADQALLQSTSGTPFGDRLGNAQPSRLMGIELHVDLPGSVEQTNGTDEDGIMTWTIPLDGSRQGIDLQTLQSPSKAPAWAGPLAIGALVALVLWVVASIVLLIVVVQARRRRAAR